MPVYLVIAWLLFDSWWLGILTAGTLSACMAWPGFQMVRKSQKPEDRNPFADIR
jgi:hypothetical protein